MDAGPLHNKLELVMLATQHPRATVRVTMDRDSWFECATCALNYVDRCPEPVYFTDTVTLEYVRGTMHAHCLECNKPL